MEQLAGMTAELYKAVVAVVDDRVGEIKVTRRDFDDLKGMVQELGRGQVEMQRAIKELSQAQTRTEERVGGLEQAMEKLAQAQTRTESSLRELAQQVGKLSENIGFGLEDVARVVLPDYLAYRHNLQLEGEPGEELRRVFFEVDGGEVEINLYGEGRRDG
jgi:chromosome segregation ATPase